MLNEKETENELDNRSVISHLYMFRNFSLLSVLQNTELCSNFIDYERAFFLFCNH
jgi:hypothetical protein